MPSADPIVIGGAWISPAESVRNLGVTIDKHLTMQQQISKACRAAYFHLTSRKIAKVRKFLSRAAVQLVSAFVISHFDYGNSLLAGLPANRLKPLTRVQYAAALVITGAKRRDSMTSHLKDLHWLPIQYRIDFKIAVLTYRCAPSYLVLYLFNVLTDVVVHSDLPPFALQCTNLFLPPLV